MSSNLTNKYNPQEQEGKHEGNFKVQILPINTILKNALHYMPVLILVQILPINTILKNAIDH